MYQWLQRLLSSSNNKAEGADALAKKEAAIKKAEQEAALRVAESKSKLEESAKPVAASSYGASWEQRSDVNANYQHWLFNAGDSDKFDLNPVEQKILDNLENIIKSSDSGSNLIKRMPGVIPQLLQSLRQENFSGADLARKIAHDVVLVGALMRLVNSSLYNPSKSITSIEHAVFILGHNGLRQLISGVAFMPIIELESGSYTKNIAPRIWAHSEHCVVACRVLAPELNVNPFEAFLAGLIQNVGLVVSLRIIDQVAGANQTIGSSDFFTALTRHAHTLSCNISREWRFPEAVSNSIEEQGKVYNTAAMSPMGKVLSLGDYLSKIRILVDNNCLTEGDPRVLHGLSAKALSCYKDLNRR